MPLGFPLRSILTGRTDFGMVVVKETPNRRWFGGYGPDNYVYYVEKGPSKFLGGTFEVQSYGELEK